MEMHSLGAINVLSIIQSILPCIYSSNSLQIAWNDHKKALDKQSKNGLMRDKLKMDIEIDEK